MADAVSEQTPESSLPGSSYTQDDITVESNHAPLETLKEAFTPSEAVDSPAQDAETTAKVDARPRHADGTFKEEKRAKPRNDAQARIDQVVREREEARRDAARYRAELEAARAPRPQPAAQPEPTAQNPQAEWQRFRAMPDAPKLDAFDTIEDYNFAVGAFITDKRLEERAQHEQQRQTFEAHAKHFNDASTKYAERMAPVLERDPQFLDRIDPRIQSLVPISALPPHERSRATFGNAVAEVFLRSDHPAAMIEYFSTHPADVQRFSTLPPDDFYREMGKLDAKLDATAAPSSGPASPPKVSQAKPLIQPVSASPPSADPLATTEDLPVDEFIRRGNAADRARRRA